MKSFLRYTFTLRFLVYLAIAFSMATLVVVMFYYCGDPTMAYITLGILSTLLLITLTGSYVKYRKYRNFNQSKNTFL